MALADLENDAVLRQNREDEIENKMRGVFGGLIEPDTNIADLPGLSPNQIAEFEILQDEWKSLREMDWVELEEDPKQRHDREDDILGILLNTVGKKMSVNEFLNVDTKKSEWKPDQKKTALALQSELRELKELDAMPENMEEQFTCLIEDQKNLKVKNQLREIRDGFKFHEYELDYDRDARLTIQEQILNYVNSNLLTQKSQKLDRASIEKAHYSDLTLLVTGDKKLKEIKELKNLVDTLVWLDSSENSKPQEILRNLEVMAKYEKNRNTKAHIMALAADLGRHLEDFYHKDLQERENCLRKVQDLIEEITGDELPFSEH